MSEEVKTIEEIKEEIERIEEMVEIDHSTFGKGKLSGLYFVLGKKLTFDGDVIKK